MNLFTPLMLRNGPTIKIASPKLPPASITSGWRSIRCDTGAVL
jgi:hypothetical protein